jgi:type III restriction enzyme
MKVILRGDSAVPDPAGNLFVVNIQQIYESRQEEWTPANALEAILGRPPRQDLAAYQPSMLERIKGLGNLMVLNDEAHHVHDDDLAWNQTLLALHENLKRTGGRGLTAWLDFSATPKTQTGTYYPWIVVDYPLAQAIEDQIVKAPLIVHQVDKQDPKRVTRKNVVQAYHDWIAVALERWREHTRVYRGVGQKPVLFIMCERISYANAVAEHIRKQTRLKKNEVLVIHTDTQGRLTKKYLDRARKAARDVDKPGSPVKIIVSVLMLREGWDVHNVTLILGLRPFTSRARILPEQAAGRGLRLMTGISPDRRQTLEVVGTEAFEDFVRELEQEGVGIDTVGTPPPLPVKIYPIQERAEFDIAIPLTKPKYTHAYRNLSDLDPLGLPPIYTTDVLAEELAIEIEMAFATTGTTVHQATITPQHPLLSQDFLRDITHAVERKLNLNGHFAELYRIVKGYVWYRCFGVEVDLDSEDIKRRLREPLLQEGMAQFLSGEITKLATEERAIEFEDAAFHLSQTEPFTWRRQHLKCEKTIFNECAVFNDLEARFARFLDDAGDVLRFATLAESYTRFRVDYLSSTGAIKFYYPDFVAVQETPQGEVNWIVETKGREYEEVAHKDASICDWCEKIAAQTRQSWRYLKVPQAVFDKAQPQVFADLVKRLGTVSANGELWGF